LGLLAALLSGATTSLLIPGILGALLTAVLTGATLLLALLHVHRAIRDEGARQAQVARDCVMLTSVEVNAALALRERFPGCGMPTSGFSMRFANLLTLINYLDVVQPEVVVELGSGISTWYVANWLRQRQSGRLISFDHDASWAEQTRNHLAQSGLADCAQVIHTPLRYRQSFARSILWYDLDRHLTAIPEVDALIVDGPPTGAKGEDAARLPALEVFCRRLSDRAVVVLDDAQREPERRILEQWRKQWPSFSLTRLDGLTGICILQRSAQATSISDTNRESHEVVVT
jgi:predicted O-methyltransferase YrrM